MITTSQPGLWDLTLPRVGQEFVKCEHCGGMRRKSAHPHAPRWLRVDGVYVQVDCMGRVLP